LGVGESGYSRCFEAIGKGAPCFSSRQGATTMFGCGLDTV
jgi:hypothetical protein